MKRTFPFRLRYAHSGASKSAAVHHQQSDASGHFHFSLRHRLPPGTMQRRDKNLVNIARITFFAAVLGAVGVLGQVPAPPTPEKNGPAPVLSQPLEGGFNASVPAGQASTTPLAISLRDAIQRGLKYNLGVLT